MLLSSLKPGIIIVLEMKFRLGRPVPLKHWKQLIRHVQVGVERFLIVIP